MLAQAERLELSRTVLETVILPIEIIPAFGAPKETRTLTHLNISF